MKFRDKDEVVKNLGEVIRHHLNLKKMTIQDLAYEIKTERSNLSNLINGNSKNPTLGKLYSIAKALDLELYELFIKLK